MSKFEQELEKLNAKQREAVETIEGPVMVIAGPGTGKTQILTLRIANILAKTDIPADAILALTFTEAAAANMRKRLVSIIGSRGYYVRIHTFHGFANRLIQDHPEHFDRIIGSRSATQVDLIAIVRRIIEEGEGERLRPFGDKYFYLLDIIKAIKDIKNEGVDPDAFDRLVEEEKREFAETPDQYHEKGAHAGKMKGEFQRRLVQIEKNEELAVCYRKYQEMLRERKLYDFEDMILETAKAMEKNEPFLREMQENHQYILVDEHQDTNGAQNKILELLCNFYPNPNLFVVGDEKQAIFRFQGASIANFLYFKDKFSGVQLINLEDNYRSTQVILDSAASLIEKNTAKLPGLLKSHKKAVAAARIRVYPFALPEAEPYFVAEEVKRLVAGGMALREVAVLYRENRDVLPLADRFEKQGIPFVVESDRGVLENPGVQKLITLFEAIDAFGDDEKLARALHIDFLDLAPLDVYALLAVPAYERGSSLYKILARKERLEAMDLEDAEELHVFYEKLVRWKRKGENGNFAVFFELVMRESGFLDHVLSETGYVEHLGMVSALFDEVKKMVENHHEFRLRDFIKYIQILKDHNVMLKKSPHHQAGAVRLMTAHRAKGLEFDAVFITGAYDGHWGNKRMTGHFALPIRTASEVGELEKNEDERRLFYMALTRARTYAYITYANRKADGRELVPSQFIGEIKEELREECSTEAYDAVFRERPEVLFAEPPKKGAEAPDAEFLKDLFLQRGLSATALNNYLKCPWNYFYNNLLRIPKAQNAHQIYGIAAHAALQKFFDAKKDGEGVDGEYLIAEFKSSLEKKPLAEKELSALAAKGEAALGGWWKHHKGSLNFRTINEFKISGVHVRDDIRLTGNLDKLEVQDDPRRVIVVDYKTKQPQSRNWIEGNTKDATGDYKRQLVFYKLLLGLKPEHTFHMDAGVIDFIEPNERGIYKKEQFEIADTEVLELKEQIIGVCDDIMRLKFWDAGCGKADCEYCRLRKIMK